MKKYFITYGDEKFTKAKERILFEASNVSWFDSVQSYGPRDISQSLKDTGLMDIPRGGGLWAWKPDIILSVLENIDDGDILVYADSGCTIQPCKEWKRIDQKLENHDIIAQRIYQSTEKWTRKEIIQMFDTNPDGWEKCLQFCATVIILKKTEFSLSLIKEWRDYVISNPEHIKDVTPEERHYQHRFFYENRHDQSIYSALIYKYLNTRKILSQWERIEDYDPISLQAIRATRLRNGERDGRIHFKEILKRFIKVAFLRSYYSFNFNRERFILSFR